MTFSALVLASACLASPAHAASSAPSFDLPRARAAEPAVRGGDDDEGDDDGDDGDDQQL